MRLIETEIRQLKSKILDMAELVQLQFDHLVKAMTSMDHDLARKIRQKEQEIDQFDTKIDKRCSRILALHQPVANDLRFVFSVTKVNGGLEQIGDAMNYIARKTLTFEQPLSEAMLQDLRLPEMLKRTRELLTRSLNAFFSENAELALTVFELDDEIDTIWQDGFYKISEYCRQDPEHAEDYMQLLLMMKNIEKIADYASAFAKETIYCVEGVYYRNTEELKAQSEASGSGEAAPQHN